MKPKELKPDFKKISFALVINELKLKSLKENWKILIKEKLPENSAKKNNFTSLLKEFNLESHFINLGLISILLTEKEEEIKDLIKLYGVIFNMMNELQNTLKFVGDKKVSDIKIEIKSKALNQSIVIDNRGVKLLLIKNLKEGFRKFDLIVNEDFCTSPKKIGWKKYIETLVEHEVYSLKKGRKKKNVLTGSYIQTFLIYLQKYTKIKADKGVLISRRQSYLIYKLLVFFELIPEELSYKEDNIRHMLNHYFVSMELRSSLDNYPLKIRNLLT